MTDDPLALGIQYVRDGWTPEDVAQRLFLPLDALTKALEVDSAIHALQAIPVAEPVRPNGRASPPPQVAPDVPPATSADDGLWSARPSLARVHAFARARRVAPEAVLGVVLARVVAATPPFVVLPGLVGGHASLNLFVGLVGPSGAGKGTATSAGMDAIDIMDCPFTTAGIGSGEGIAHLYARRRRGEIERHTDAVLFDVREVDTLTALAVRRGGTLLPELRRAWSGEALGFSYADPDKRLPIDAHSYRLVMVVGIQPSQAAGLLDDADAGTPQRMLWMSTVDPDAPDDRPPAVEGLAWKAPPWPLADHATGRVVLDVCPEARTDIDAARLATLRGRGGGLDGHALQGRLKVAAALSLMEGRTDVTAEDWQLAGLITARSDRTRAAVVAEIQRQASEDNRRRGEAEADRASLVSDRINEDTTRRVCNVLKRRMNRAGDWVTRGDLRRALDSRDRGHFDVAADRLLTAGQIEADDDGRRFRIAPRST